MKKEKGIKPHLSIDDKDEVKISDEKEAAFVPVCTRNVFSKTYTDYPDDLKYWTEKDAAYYRTDMEKTLWWYILKNPDELAVAMKKAFCDSIAFKVMPKLRGVEVRGQNEEKFEQIGNILATNAEELIPDYNHARELTTELFQWCSADFMNKDDE